MTMKDEPKGKNGAHAGGMADLKRRLNDSATVLRSIRDSHNDSNGLLKRIAESMDVLRHRATTDLDQNKELLTAVLNESEMSRLRFEALEAGLEGINKRLDRLMLATPPVAAAMVPVSMPSAEGAQQP